MRIERTLVAGVPVWCRGAYRASVRRLKKLASSRWQAANKRAEPHRLRKIARTLPPTELPLFIKEHGL